MTGHGEAHRQRGGVAVSVELRTVNNRYLKLQVRATEGYAALESRIEELVRQKVRRGTVQVGLRIDCEATADQYRINETVLRSYARQLNSLGMELESEEQVGLKSLVLLPGVVTERQPSTDVAEEHWPLVREALEVALEQLETMRREEGKAMAADLTANCKALAAEADKIEERCPAVVEAYRARLLERINKLLEEFGVRIQPADIVKEVGLFADRADVSEELVRLRSHLEQFTAVLAANESNGRKLDFLTQEMFRETNTIGSKANDAEISRRMVEMKTTIERIREMVQNVE